MALVPNGVVTLTPTKPTPWAGETAVIDVPLFNVKLVAAVLPNITLVTPVKSVPVRVTDVPPAVAPDGGERLVTAGGATKVNWSAPEVALVPLGVITVTSTMPEEPAGERAVIVVALVTIKPEAA